MTILSFSFLFFCLGLVFIYYLFPIQKRWIILLLGSILFYFFSSKWLILYPLLTSTIIYTLGLALGKRNVELASLKTADLSDDEKSSKRDRLKRFKKHCVILGVVLSILLIIVTKYANFILDNLLSLFRIFAKDTSWPIPNILIPLGISYYTLDAISYIVDVYRGKIEPCKNFFKVLLYLLYFPKIIEGPISRFKELSEYFFENSKLDFKNVTIGLDLIMYGLFKKMIIADRAGIFVNDIFGNATGGATTILAMLLYTVQIYAEFSGCIDIVRGVSYLFGIKLPQNFNSPFFSKTIQEFWQRWHISLGAWIKEYVFYPVSLSKMNRYVSKVSKDHLNNYLSKFVMVAFPLFFVWLINGIWHGASYKYVVYGMYYYVFMMASLLLKPVFDGILAKIKLNGTILNAVRITRTCLFVIVGMTLFRSSSLSEFAALLGSIFKPSAGVLNHGLVGIDFIILLFSNIIVLIVSILEDKKKISLDDGFTEKPLVRSLVYTFILCSIIIFGIYGEGYDASEFIYGAF